MFSPSVVQSALGNKRKGKDLNDYSSIKVKKYQIHMDESRKHRSFTPGKVADF